MSTKRRFFRVAALTWYRHFRLTAMNEGAIRGKLVRLEVERLRPASVLVFNLFLRGGAAKKAVLFRERNQLMTWPVGLKWPGIR